MLIVCHAPFEPDHFLRVKNPEGKTLGTLCAGVAASITACDIDGWPCPEWRTYVPTHERIDLYVRPTDPVTAGIIGGIILEALLVAVIAVGISYVAGKLFGPKQLGKETGRTEEVFGVAGLTNTVALGTPKILCYGTRRIFGHIIGTKTSVAQDGRTTNFAILYFMGEGEIETISNIQINDTPISAFVGASYQIRTGTVDQSPIPEFPSASQVYADGRELDLNTPFTYTTKGNNIDSVTLIFSVPYLFNTKESTGQLNPTKISQRIEYRRSSGGAFTEAPGSPDTWNGFATTTSYRPFTIVFPDQDEWEIRLQAVPVSGGTNDNNQQAFLFTVQEDVSGVRSFPNNALLAVFGVASRQIQSFESLRVSALVTGRKVEIWNGATFSTAWTNKRAWIIRDLLVNARVALGHRVLASMIDDDSFLEAQNYYDEIVDGEARDQCDILINERRFGVDWLKELLGEGRATLVPSGGKLRYIVDRPQSPDLLYSMPGNILEGSMRTLWGGEGNPINTIRGEFPDTDNHDRLAIQTVTAADIGSEPLREQLVSLRSIIRRSHAWRELQYQLKKRRQIQRRFLWTSPMTALVSEPFDVATVSYETTNQRRGVSGIAPAGSTTTRLVLDRLVTLGIGTQTVIVRHLADNTREQRTVATATGTWGALVPTTAFTVAPVEGDLWAVGPLQTHLIDVLVEAVTRTGEGHYDLQTAQYDATIYDAPAFPISPPAGPNQLPPTTDLMPLPLSTANVTNFIEYLPDGTWVGKMGLAVAPGRAIWSGTVVLGFAAAVEIETTNPAIDGFFTAVGSTLLIIGGLGAGQQRQVIGYNGTTVPTFRLTVESDWTVIPDNSSLYEIRFEPAGLFWGFDVELKMNDITDFVHWGTFEGTEGVLTSVPQDFSGQVRFIPVNQTGIRNPNAPWIITFASVVDTRVPAPLTGWP